MNISKIYLGDNFVPDVITDQYRRRQVHIEVTIKEGESVSEAEALAERYIKDYIKRNTVEQYNHIEEKYVTIAPIAEIQIEEPAVPDTRTKEQKQIDLINSFTTLSKPDGLESMYLVVKNKPELLDAYNKKHFELSNQ